MIKCKCRLFFSLICIFSAHGCYCSCGTSYFLCINVLDTNKNPLKVDQLSYQLNGGQTTILYNKGQCEKDNDSQECNTTTHCIGGFPGIYTIEAQHKGKVIKKLVYLNTKPTGEYFLIFPCETEKKSIDIIFIDSG